MIPDLTHPTYSPNLKFLHMLFCRIFVDGGGGDDNKKTVVNYCNAQLGLNAAHEMNFKGFQCCLLTFLFQVICIKLQSQPFSK